MNHTLDPVFAAALRRDLVALPTSRSPRHHRRMLAVGAGVLASLALGGAVAVAGLRPPGEVASPALAPPVIVNGVGPARVVLPDAPSNAVYVRIELTCFDGARCHTPGGGVDGPVDGRPKVQRDALPLTNAPDPTNPQVLAPLTPASGLTIDVTPGTHWRLYAVYTDGLNPQPAPVVDGKLLGIPSNYFTPDLVPVVATNGRAGWVDYHRLTDEAHPQLTADGTHQADIPVFDVDGTTQIGVADVSETYTSAT